MHRIYAICIVFFASILVLYSLQSYCPEYVAFFSNAFPPLVASAAVIMSGFSLTKYWHRSKERFSLVWLFFTVGLFLWFVGEAIWAGYTLIWNVEVPYPSIVDAFWFAGYIPLFIAIYLYVKIFNSVLSRTTVLLSLLVTAIVAVAVSSTIIWPITAGEADLVTLIADFAYPILDLALLSVAFLGLLIFVRGNLGKSWAFINAAIFLTVCADVLFSYTTLQGTYYSGHPIDLLYLFAYVFFLLAFYVHTTEL